MRKVSFLWLLALLAVCSCGEKKDNAKEEVPVKVKLETVGSASLVGGEIYTGTVEEMNGVALSFNVGGTLMQLLVDEGQTVNKGQLIAVIDGQDASNALEMSHSAVRTAQAAYNQALDAYKRMKMIHDKGSLPDIKWVEAQSKLDQARSALEGAKAQSRIASKGLGDTRLYASFGGYISRKNVEIGQTVMLGQAIVNLVRIDQVKVKVSVPENEISKISQGSIVKISVDALGGRVYTGRVTEKNVSADPLSHTYEVKAIVANADHKLLPGMIAEVQVPETVTNSAKVTLPAGIVQLDSNNRTFVWTVRNGKTYMTFITTGENIGDKVNITDGLKQGDRVIVEGQQKVSSGMAVSE